MRIKDFEAFEKRCRELTKEFYKGYDVDIDEKELSEKAKFVKDKLETGEFGCRTQVVKELFSKFLDEEIPVKYDEDTEDYYTGIPMPPAGVLFILYSNPNSHEYEDEVCLKSHSDRAIFDNGEHANHLPSEEEDGDYSLIYEKPTEDQIEMFFDNLRKTNERGNIERAFPIYEVFAIEHLVEDI